MKELEPVEVKTLNDLQSCINTDKETSSKDHKLLMRIEEESVKRDEMRQRAEEHEERARVLEDEAEKLYQTRDEQKELHMERQIELNTLLAEINDM